MNQKRLKTIIYVVALVAYDISYCADVADLAVVVVVVSRQFVAAGVVVVFCCCISSCCCVDNGVMDVDG